MSNAKERSLEVMRALVYKKVTFEELAKELGVSFVHQTPGGHGDQQCYVGHPCPGVPSIRNHEHVQIGPQFPDAYTWPSNVNYDSFTWNRQLAKETYEWTKRNAARMNISPKTDEDAKRENQQEKEQREKESREIEEQLGMTPIHDYPIGFRVPELESKKTPKK